MSLFYHVHLQSIGDLDEQSYLSKMSSIGLILDDWPNDDLFQTMDGHFFITNRLACKLIKSELTGFNIKKIDRVISGPMWKIKYPDFDTDNYCKFTTSGQVGKVDLFLFEDSYLVASEKALNFLRANHVICYPYNLIDCDFELYFHSDRVLFWMSEDSSKKYLREEIRNKYGNS
jgi:hypothetical protein